MRFMSIGTEAPPVRAHPSFTLRFEGARWSLVVSGASADPRKMFSGTEAEAKAVQAFALRHPAYAWQCVDKLYSEAALEPLEKFVQDALAFAARPPKRRHLVTLVLEVESDGSESDVDTYLRDRMQYATRVSEVRSITFKGSRND